MKNHWLAAWIGVASIGLGGCSSQKSEPPSRFADAPPAAAEGAPETRQPGAPIAPARKTPPNTPVETASAPAASTPVAARPVRREIVVPAGTQLSVRTTSTLSTKTNAVGETFAASLSEPLIVNGKVLAPAGSNVTGRVSSSTAGGKVKGVASLGLRISSVTLADGAEMNVSTNSYLQEAKATKKKDALKVGIGSGIGAAIGAIAGGGKGAAIGAGVGAGAGTGAVLMTRGDAAVIPAESLLTFRTTEAVSVRD